MFLKHILADWQTIYTAWSLSDGQTLANKTKPGPSFQL